VIRFAAFETPLGLCAIAWRGDVIVGTALPAPKGQATLHHLQRRFPESEEAAVSEQVRKIIQRIVALLSGEPQDLSSIPVAFDEASEFERRVYAAASAIPVGETRTYGQIAASVGEPGAARAVGRALGRNPVPIIVPCHRVLAADGRTGGFSAPGGVSTKMKLLEIERARTADQPSLFDLSWAARPRA
jgi:methylated-DNA-[protein]-cysteine S-methyltransferase